MVTRVVVKFGGSDLSSERKINKAAQMIEEANYNEIVVVVSAMGQTTDNLIDHMSTMEKVDDIDYADIVAMGERISCRMFSVALKARGVKSTYFDPQQDRWPVITDSNYKSARLNFKETKDRIKKYLEPLLGEYIPVVCGFLGKDRNGNITTLGRGGSDTTALLLGNCLDANEVILVKDTDVLSADPKIIPHAKPLNKLTIEEMFSLAQGGAKIIRSEALKFKLPHQRLRIIDFSSKKLTGEGTEIVGVFKSNSTDIKIHHGLTAITLVGSITAQNLSQLFVALGNRKIFGVSTGGSSITVFTYLESPNQTLEILHDLDCFRAVSSAEEVGAIELINPLFIDSPGWVAKISNILANEEINILEVTTSKATINIFINEKKLNDAVSALGGLNET